MNQISQLVDSFLQEKGIEESYRESLEITSIKYSQWTIEVSYHFQSQQKVKVTATLHLDTSEIGIKLEKDTAQETYYDLPQDYLTDTIEMRVEILDLENLPEED